MAAMTMCGAGLGTAASAGTITFSNYTSSNGADMLTPSVTVSDVAGGFLVSVSHVGSSDGHLNLLAFDLGSATFTSADVTNVANDGAALAFQSVCTNTGQNQVKTGKYCFGTTVPTGGNSNNLNPFDTSAFDVVLAFFNNDSIADLGSTLTFNLSNKGGSLTLDDFLSVGLRYQSANNRAGSDKLIGTPEPQPAPVPLPAAGMLLLGGLGALGAMRRKTA
jgi:hypothetical protein